MSIQANNGLIDRWMYQHTTKEERKANRCHSPGDYNYHQNWALLMPVIIKISEQPAYIDPGCPPYSDVAYPRTFGMRDEKGLYVFRFNANQLHEHETLIMAAWMAVVDFIQSRDEDRII